MSIIRAVTEYAAALANLHPELRPRYDELVRAESPRSLGHPDAPEGRGAGRVRTDAER